MRYVVIPYRLYENISIKSFFKKCGLIPIAEINIENPNSSIALKYTLFLISFVLPAKNRSIYKTHNARLIVANVYVAGLFDPEEYMIERWLVIMNNPSKLRYLLILNMYFFIESCLKLSFVFYFPLLLKFCLL